MIVQDPLVDARNGNIECRVCTRRCVIKDGGIGFCGIRKNVGGKVDLIVYGRPSALGIDPIEKKPQYHFLPGTGAYSLGTYGCTFMCKFCCNWELAQAIRNKLPMDVWHDLPPERVVSEAKLNGCSSIAYTYNEPAIWYEYHRDIGNIAKGEGLFSLLITDGYGTQEFWERASSYVDAASIDFKGFNRKFYAEYTGAMLDPVIESVRKAKGLGIWVEATMLVIEGKNDDDSDMRRAFEFLKGVDAGMPVHLIAFHPSYKMMDVPPTGAKRLEELRETAVGAGLDYVYVGNVPSKYESTFCPKCGEMLVKRDGFLVRLGESFEAESARCGRCGEIIPGIWTKGQAFAERKRRGMV